MSNLAENTNYCIFVRNRATQIKRWKDILEALKDFLIGVVNFEFKPEGIQLLAMDGSNTALAYLLLQADGFMEYDCKERQSIGLKIVDLLKTIKAMSDSDDMTFMIAKDSLQLTIVGKDVQKKTVIEYKLPSLSTDSKRFRIPSTEWGRTIQIPTKDFKSYITKLSGTGSDVVAIEWRRGILSLAASDDTIRAKISVSTVERKVAEADPNFNGSSLNAEAEQQPKRQKLSQQEPFLDHQFTNHSDVLEPPSETPALVAREEVANFSRTFDMKYLSFFTKAEPLNAVVRVLLREDYPLCLTYEITDWGQLTFVLNPKAEEDDHDQGGDFDEFNEF